MLKPTTLNQAQQEALESEVWFKERNQGRIRAPQSLPQRPNKPTTSPFQRQVTTNQVKSPSLSNPPNHLMPLQQRLQLFCNFCKNVGHQKSQSYSKQKNFQKGIHSSRPPNRVNHLQVETLCSELLEESQEVTLITTETEYPLFPDDYSIRGFLLGTRGSAYLMIFLYQKTV